jgi:3',5'-cyclic AMP phosphodiesterase CpdA
MTLLHLSDTHGKHKELKDLPSADIIVHTGDFTYAGGEDEAMDFMNWFSDLPYAHKIFIAGNHDLCMYGADHIEGLPDNVHYLCGTGVTINGYQQLRRLPNLRYHLFGHDHNNFGVLKQRDVVYSNAALLTKDYELIHQPRLFVIR